VAVFRGGLGVLHGEDKNTFNIVLCTKKIHIPAVLFSTAGGSLFVFNFLMKKDHHQGMFSKMGRI
jgi:hypothetical protein